MHSNPLDNLHTEAMYQRSVQVAEPHEDLRPSTYEVQLGSRNMKSKTGAMLHLGCAVLGQSASEK